MPRPALSPEPGDQPRSLCVFERLRCALSAVFRLANKKCPNRYEPGDSEVYSVRQSKTIRSLYPDHLPAQTQAGEELAPPGLEERSTDAGSRRETAFPGAFRLYPP